MACAQSLFYMAAIEGDWKWSDVRQHLPFDLDGLARETGALQRLRGVETADALTQILLMCALPEASFERVSRWAREAGIAKMNASALFFRFRDSVPFLEAILSEVLQSSVPCSPSLPGFRRILAVDATVLCGPNSKGTDQRVHVVYNLDSWIPISVEVTSPKGGETLARHHCWGPGDFVLADRGYGHARGILSALESGASFLVRFEFTSFRLLDKDGRIIKPDEAASRIPKRSWAEFEVFIPGCERALRAIGTRKPDGDIVWLLTDVSTDKLSGEKAQGLYRLRWQVELHFKRMKSLLKLGSLPTRNGPTARSWILAKLILSALAVLVRDERFSPWEEQMEGLRAGSVVTPTRHATLSAEKPAQGAAQKDKGHQKVQATLLLEV